MFEKKNLNSHYGSLSGMNKPLYLNELKKLCLNYEGDGSFVDFCLDQLPICQEKHPREDRMVDWQEYSTEWLDDAMNSILDLKLMGVEYQCIYNKEIYQMLCKYCMQTSYYYPGKRNYCHYCKSPGLLTVYSHVHHFCPTFSLFVKEYKKTLLHALKIDFIK